MTIVDQIKKILEQKDNCIVTSGTGDDENTVHVGDVNMKNLQRNLIIAFGPNRVVKHKGGLKVCSETINKN